MLKEDCKEGMKVTFGRRHGEKSLGVVRKCNRSKAKVELLEERGRGRGSVVGTTWIVPYSMMEPAEEGEKTVKAPMGYNPFEGAADQHIMEAIVSLYSDLSPENLSCDGELTTSQVAGKRAKLLRKLEGCFKAYGRQVSESEAYEWYRQRQEARTTFGGVRDIIRGVRVVVDEDRTILERD